MSENKEENKDEKNLEDQIEMDGEDSASGTPGFGTANGGGRSSDLAAALEKAQAENLYLRAEFDNTKRRILREQEQAVRFANEKLLGDLLSVVDLFERAIASSGKLKARGDAEVSGFITGVEMTHRELGQLLARFGVEFIGSVGEKFDPVRHEAISQRPVSAEEEGTVVDVAQKGAMMNGRLVKPAKVVVGTHS